MKLPLAGWLFGLAVAGLLGCSSDDKELGQGTGGTAGAGGGATGGAGGGTGATGGAGGSIGGSGGAAGAGGAEAACTKSGGTVSTGQCCQTAVDFPNTCAVGACGCAPASSHQVKVCECPTGTCFDGTECTGAGGSGGAAGGGGSGGAAGGGGAAACVAAGGTVVTQSCCTSAGDFPNTCGVGACGCSPSNSHDIQACQCPSGKCWDGSTCK